VRVRLRFANKQGLLKPNMFAQVTIHSDLDGQSLLVPREAVIRTGQQDRVVLALGEGRFKSIEIVLGQMTSDYAQVLSGLELGDRVVTSAQFLLDSESSISSDFERISHRHSKHDDLPGMGASLDHRQQVEEQQINNEAFSATVTGLINSIDRQSRQINISRGPIEKWSRGPATMDFYFDESLNLALFNPGDGIRFTFEVSKDQLVVLDAELLLAGQVKQVTGR
jgi:Cu(I)/Ag(I) efflux system membrane fusion protein